MKRACGTVVLLLMLAACGGSGSPSQPTGAASPTPATGWPAGTVVRLVSGDTGAPIDGKLSVAGVDVQAGAPLAVAVPATVTVDVVLTSFLTRQTLARTGETRLSLWPDDASLPGEYTQMLVHTEYDGTLAPLRRLPDRVRTVAVVPAADLQADGAAIEALHQAVQALNTGSVPAGVTYVVGGTGDLTVPVKADPAATNCTTYDWLAFTDTWLGTGGDIDRAEVTYCSGAAARDPRIGAHELGHTFGLLHSSRHNDLMEMYAYPGRSPVPTEREALVMRLMRQRRSGTAWPDNDRNTQAAAVRHLVSP